MGASGSKVARRKDSRQFDMFAMDMTVEASDAAIIAFPLASSLVSGALSQGAASLDQTRSVKRSPKSHVSGKIRTSTSCEASASKVKPKRRALEEVNFRVVTEADLPIYGDHEASLIDLSMAALPSGKIWFTYADIRDAFTISRATVVRRLRAGCVPGVRFAGDRMLEDGGVRRLTREQVRYLLLSVRRN